MKSLLRFKNIIIGLIIIVVSFFVIKNMINKYAAAKADLKNKIEETIRGAELIDRWSDISLKFVNAAKPFFVNDEGLFKKFVEEKSKNAGLSVNYLSPTSQNKDFYLEIVINLRATSDSYANIINFLRSIEEKKIIVEKFRLRKDSEEKRNFEVNFKSFIIIIQE